MSVIYLLIIVVLAATNVEGRETCRQRHLDFAFLVDGSATICAGLPIPCPRYTAILEFCKNIVKSLDIGYRKTRVAFITFNDTTNLEWNLLGYTNESSLCAAIDGVNFPGSEFEDFLSIPEIISEVYDPLFGDRFGVQNIGMLITDGAPKNLDEIYAAFSTAVQLDDVAMFVVCNRPGCTEHYASGISSLPKKVNETYFFVDDYLNIDRVRDILVKKFCDFESVLNKVLDTVNKV